MVPAQTTLTLDVKGQAGQWAPRSPGEVRGQVMNALTPYFHVYDVTLTTGTDTVFDTGFGFWNWTYAAVVTLQTREPYATVDDVASIVAHAFYNAAGTVPVVTTRDVGPQQGIDVDLSPSWMSVGALLALGAVAVAAVIYLPKPS